MKNRKDENDLINELLADPAGFDEQGKAYQLLQCYFRGLSLDTLRPLLTHANGLVRRAAIFIVSELGEGASSLLDEVVPLIRDPDHHIQWDALESVMVCSNGNLADRFVFVIRELENDTAIIRRLAMRLVSNASLLQLESGSKMSYTLSASGVLHKQGLSILVKGNSVNESDVTSMLNAPDPLTRRYGAIAAKRLSEASPNLLAISASNTDDDVKIFSIDALNC